MPADDPRRRQHRANAWTANRDVQPAGWRVLLEAGAPAADVEVDLHSPRRLGTAGNSSAEHKKRARTQRAARLLHKQSTCSISLSVARRMTWSVSPLGSIGRRVIRDRQHWMRGQPCQRSLGCLLGRRYGVESVLDHADVGDQRQPLEVAPPVEVERRKPKLVTQPQLFVRKERIGQRKELDVLELLALLCAESPNTSTPWTRNSASESRTLHASGVQPRAPGIAVHSSSRSSSPGPPMPG